MKTKEEDKESRSRGVKKWMAKDPKVTSFPRKRESAFLPAYNGSAFAGTTWIFIRSGGPKADGNTHSERQDVTSLAASQMDATFDFTERSGNVIENKGSELADMHPNRECL